MFATMDTGNVLLLVAAVVLIICGLIYIIRGR